MSPFERIIVPGKPLGRHVAHDERSRAFPAMGAAELQTVRHARRVPIFNQGELGSCTGNAAVGCLSTDPYGLDGDEDLAIAVYSEATKLDRIRGVFPPNDTGSSGLAVMKALKNRGTIAAYHHAFGIDHVLAALVLRPGITGITWLTGCDNPDSDGVVSYSGDVRGGHEVELVGLDKEAHLVWFANSWGEDFGLDGYFAMTWADYAAALSNHGDATFPAL